MTALAVEKLEKPEGLEERGLLHPWDDRNKFKLIQGEPAEEKEPANENPVENGQAPVENEPAKEAVLPEADEYEDKIKLVTDKEMAGELARAEEPSNSAAGNPNEKPMVLNMEGLTKGEELPAKAPESTIEAAKQTSEPASGEVKIKINKPVSQETPPENNAQETPDPEISPESKEVAPAPVEAVPEPDKELGKLEAIYQDIGRIIIANWREYVSDYPKYHGTGSIKNMQPEIFRKYSLGIEKIISDFNDELKKQNKDTVDCDLPILASLKEIYNQILILRLTEGTNTKQVESLDSVMKNELGQLLNVGKENQPILEEYLTNLAEQINSGEYISRDELGREIINLAKEEINKTEGIPEQEVLNTVFESKFGEMVKPMGLFELVILMKRNEVIRETAQKRGDVPSIVLLTDAFAKYLEVKKVEKETKTKEFLAKKMAQMAA